jgi:hypothetical protein
MSTIDAGFNGQIFRKDNIQVILTNRQLASLLPIRVLYSASGYYAGTVLARNTTSGIYQTYLSGGASGTGTAACVLNRDINPEDFASSADTQTSVGIFGGEVDKSVLIGFDANAQTNLNARQIVDALGSTIVKF